MSSATTEQIANSPNISRKTPIPVPPEYGGTGSAQAATGTGSVVLSNNPVLVTPNLGTPSSVVLTHGTGLVPSSGLAASGTPSSSTFLRGDNTWAATTTPVNGTWTPTFINLTVVGTPAHTGTYVKVGKIVFYQITIAASTSVATTTSTICDNFPFTGTLGYTPCSMCSDDQTQTAIGLGGGNNTVIYMGNITATSKIQVSGFVLAS